MGLKLVVTTLRTRIKGGAGSGNFGHSGRKGKRGGSAPKSGAGGSAFPMADPMKAAQTHNAAVNVAFEHSRQNMRDEVAKVAREANMRTGRDTVRQRAHALGYRNSQIDFTDEKDGRQRVTLNGKKTKLYISPQGKIVDRKGNPAPGWSQ